MKEYICCDYCNSLLKHITILGHELKTERQTTLLELKCYYWLIEEYCIKIISKCNCPFKTEFKNILLDLHEVFRENKIELDGKKRRCDICKILPKELFVMLDSTCKKTDERELELACVELQYQFFLTYIYSELIGECTECNEYIEYSACVKNTCEYINYKDLKKLREFVYHWKIAENNDVIINDFYNLKFGMNIETERINLNGCITIYLDFNVYNLYEKEDKIIDFFANLIKRKEIAIVYSNVHLEEILRMNNEKKELTRVESIQTITGGKNIKINRDRKLVMCIENTKKRLQDIKRYRSMNDAAEVRECIVNEKREYLDHNEQRDKAVGSSSLEQIINNSLLGDKRNFDLPDEDDLNFVLKQVGGLKDDIQQLKNMLSGGEDEFGQINAAIVSLARLLNWIGLNGDKITKKNSTNAVYPIYGKDSFRTIRSGYYDSEHLSFAVSCRYFVTTDKILYKKAKEIYKFLGVKTIPVMLDEFMSMPLDT